MQNGVEQGVAKLHIDGAVEHGSLIQRFSRMHGLKMSIFVRQKRSDWQYSFHTSNSACLRKADDTLFACPAQASLASGVVDVCLIPEVPFALHGDFGLLAYVEKVLSAKGNAVICVAEGAAQVSSYGTRMLAVMSCILYMSGLWAGVHLTTQASTEHG